MPPSRIGDVSSGLGTPDKYILLDRDDQPVLRVDAYANSNESYAFQDALVWCGLLAVGWGDRVYLVQLESQVIVDHALGAYFGHLYAEKEYLLVASGERVLRIASDGSVAWQSDVLGIDGVIIDDVVDGIITGSGEWDPPGGWQPFQIRLDSGELVPLG